MDSDVVDWVGLEKLIWCVDGGRYLLGDFGDSGSQVV